MLLLSPCSIGYTYPHGWACVSFPWRTSIKPSEGASLGFCPTVVRRHGEAHLAHAAPPPYRRGADPTGARVGLLDFSSSAPSVCARAHRVRLGMCESTIGRSQLWCVRPCLCHRRDVHAGGVHPELRSTAKNLWNRSARNLRRYDVRPCELRCVRACLCNGGNLLPWHLSRRLRGRRLEALR